MVLVTDLKRGSSRTQHHLASVFLVPRPQSALSADRVAPRNHSVPAELIPFSPTPEALTLGSVYTPFSSGFPRDNT